MQIDATASKVGAHVLSGARQSASRWNPKARLSESPVAVKLEAEQQKFGGALGTPDVAPSPSCADELDFTSARSLSAFTLADYSD